MPSPHTRLLLTLSFCGCALAPPAQDTDWLQRCQQSVQPIPLPATSVLADYDGDGEVEILSATTNPDEMRLTAWDRVGDTFAPITTSPALDPWLLPYAYPLEHRGQPALLRSTGSLLVMSWPELELLYSNTQGAARLQVLGNRMVFISDWGAHPLVHGAVLDLETETMHPVSIDGSEIDSVVAPDASLWAIHEAPTGRRALAHLWIEHDRTPTVHLYDWPRRAELLAALELDGDPTPELLGVRRRHIALVDRRDGKWHWSAPLAPASSTTEVVGAFPLDDSPGIDILLWSPAMLLSECSGQGCARIRELSPLGDASWRAYLDETGVVTWLSPQGISQLRCDRP